MTIRLSATLVALALMTGCGMLDRLTAPPSPPPPDDAARRAGADRQVSASGLAADRRPARHTADGEAIDESRGQPLGSIVPPGSPRADDRPPAPIPEPVASARP